MYFLLNIGTFHCCVSLPEGSPSMIHVLQFEVTFWHCLFSGLIISCILLRDNRRQSIIPDLFRNQTSAPWFFPSRELTPECPAKLMVWTMFRLPFWGFLRTGIFFSFQPLIVSGFFGLKNTPTSRLAWRKPWVKKILQKAWSTNMSTIFVGESSACTWGTKKHTTLMGCCNWGVLGNAG